MPRLQAQQAPAADPARHHRDPSPGLLPGLQNRTEDYAIKLFSSFCVVSKIRILNIKSLLDTSIYCRLIDVNSNNRGFRINSLNCIHQDSASTANIEDSLALRGEEWDYSGSV